MACHRFRTGDRQVALLQINACMEQCAHCTHNTARSQRLGTSLTTRAFGLPALLFNVIPNIAPGQETVRFVAWLLAIKRMYGVPAGSWWVFDELPAAL